MLYLWSEVSKMNKKKFLVEYLSNISTVIKQPLQQTQRIKFTCFDVSRNFIVFGATSGGIYVFNRYPCKFIKLLPNKEGSVTNILINSNENSVAISTLKGLIVVIDNCFSDNNKYQVYSEHEGQVITALKWHYYELYVGDDSGHISVIELTNKQSIFQCPYATLMHLDTGITQLDCYEKYLLASTKTRTYICDTERERYGQIGKKLRDGNFGACFYSKLNNAIGIEAVKKPERTVFKNLQESECLTFENIEGVTIYCARPGCRIWEAKFDGSVLCTHQFKESFHVKSSNIIHISDDMNVSEFNHVPAMPFNFERIFMFGKYILSFCQRGIFIFDINSVKLLFWTDYFQGIHDVKMIDNVLYIWCGKFYLKTLQLMDIEEIIMNSLSATQYLLCSKLCLYFKEDLLKMTDCRLDRLKILKEKISDTGLLDKLSPILDSIPEPAISTKKLRNGIYVVNSAPESLALLEKKSEDVPNTDEPNLREAINILYNQYQINKISKNMDTPKCLELIHKTGIADFIDFYGPFINHVNNIHSTKEDYPEAWFYSFVLRYISKNTTIDLINPVILDFVRKAFVSLNQTNEEHICNCFFPLPTAKNQSCQYYQIGCELLKYLDFSEICKYIPYMYKRILQSNQNDIALLMQYDDFELFQLYSQQFTYDVWDDCCKLLLKLRKSICLNCDMHFNANVSLNWTSFSKTMLRSLGGSCTIKLLSRYAKDIKPGEINHDFYQLCIVFSTMENSCCVSKDGSFKFLDSIENNSNTAKEVEKSVEKYLSKRSSGAIHYSSEKHSCSVCDNPKMPILDEFIRLKCGHICHKICSIDLKVCKLCTEN